MADQARPETLGFQKPLDSGKRKPVKIARISYGSVKGREFAKCSCGNLFLQKREKPREDAIDRHINRRHNGRGIRL